MKTKQITNQSKEALYSLYAMSESRLHSQRIKRGLEAKKNRNEKSKNG